MLIDPTKCVIQYNFGMLRDVRVIKMKDEQGNWRDGVFVPFMQNGIRWDKTNVRKPPIHLLRAVFRPRAKTLFDLYPMVNQQMHDEMVQGGVLDPNDNNWVEQCGYISESQVTK